MSFWVFPSCLLFVAVMKTQSYQICLELIFGEKVQNLRDNLDGTEICQNYHEFEGSVPSHFDPVTEKSVILKAPSKFQTIFFLNDDLILSITNVINNSLMNGFDTIKIIEDVVFISNLRSTLP